MQRLGRTNGGGGWGGAPVSGAVIQGAQICPFLTQNCSLGFTKGRIGSKRGAIVTPFQLYSGANEKKDSRCGPVQINYIIT